MAKKIIINETSFKEILKEEISFAYAISDVLEFVKSVPKETLGAVVSGQKAKYVEYLTTIHFKDGTTKTVIPNDYNFDNFCDFLLKNGWDIESFAGTSYPIFSKGRAKVEVTFYEDVSFDEFMKRYRNGGTYAGKEPELLKKLPEDKMPSFVDYVEFYVCIKDMFS